jgi:tRNA-splicing ligase RtcB
MAVPRSLQKISEVVWELPATYKPGMRVPARLYASRRLLEHMDDGVFEQISNVACLPGIEGAACCMPDGHWGYGFPIGGVAAMRAEDGVVSPGGIGFDINCGMRLVATHLTLEDIKPHVKRLVDRLFQRVPTGAGAAGFVRMDRDDFRAMLREGAGWCLSRGYAWPEDLDRTEDGGCAPDADPDAVSSKAIDRGLDQIGTLGSGNHYLEIQVVPPGGIFDAAAAQTLGLREGQVAVMFHCGSRGFGHQVASDAMERFLPLMGSRWGLQVPDRQLACAPLSTPEARAYLTAMRCAINMSFANRQVILHRIREVFREVLGRSAEELGLRQVYDIAHNTAKWEGISVGGAVQRLLVHRKGATRAYGPGFAGLPETYRAIGQPVIIGGSMETGSYLLLGTDSAREAFYSTAHGAGRVMSRGKAKQLYQGRKLFEQMNARGIYVRSPSWTGLAEEAGGAYKDVDEVIRAAEQAGLGRRVARFTPLGNIKG